MGSKHSLAPEVATLVREYEPDRPFLDLFCGMCSVGGAVARGGRVVWGNDVQWSASLVAKCLLTAREDPLPPADIQAALIRDYHRNRRRLSKRFATQLRQERSILKDPTLEDFHAAYRSWSHAANDIRRAREVASLSKRPTNFPYRLFTLSFAWGYFGLEQAIEIDSLRFAIDTARARRSLSSEQARWALLSLMQAASCVASTPGHFAQYLNASTEAGLARVVSQRRRSLWNQFYWEWASVAPYGTAHWRAGNHVMRRDAVGIWSELRRRGFKDGIIYADPPYSKDHYSRYYHVLETLVRYDYPSATGAGRYRPDRFVTPFSLTTKAESAFDELFRGVAATGSVMVLSYPTNGLLRSREIERLLLARFREVELALCRPMAHSTLGARHGQAKNRVHELVYLASTARHD